MDDSPDDADDKPRIGDEIEGGTRARASRARTTRACHPERTVERLSPGGL